MSTPYRIRAEGGDNKIYFLYGCNPMCRLLLPHYVHMLTSPLKKNRPIAERFSLSSRSVSMRPHDVVNHMEMEGNATPGRKISPPGALSFQCGWRSRRPHSSIQSAFAGEEFPVLIHFLRRYLHGQVLPCAFKRVCNFSAFNAGSLHIDL